MEYTLAQLIDAHWLESTKPLPHELEALRDCPQDATHHPEGDALTHTILCVKQIDSFHGSFGLLGQDAPLWLKLAIVCHDLGKATTTALIDGKWHAYGHEGASGGLACLMLKRAVDARDLTETNYHAIHELILDHMTPYHLLHNNAPLAAYLRVERRLVEAGVTIEHLEVMFSCDVLGRGKDRDDRLARYYAIMQQIGLHHLNAVAPPVVLGRHLIARGFKPGPNFKPILATCHQLQLDLDITDANQLLDIALNGS